LSRKAPIVVLCLSGVLLLGLLAFNYLVKPPTAEAASASSARIGAVVGQVEVRKQGAKRWLPTEVGQLMVAGDEIRTGLFSEATLRVRGESSVVVSSNTSFVIGKEMLDKSFFKLGAGQISAAIPTTASREYQFGSNGSDAVAAAKSGEFSLSSDGRGTVVLDTQAGKVRLRAKGKEVVVRKGRRSVVFPDKSPSKPLTIPSSVALLVKWPPGKLDRTRTSVSGKTGAGSLVIINGILARADALGKFSLDVPLREGSNRLVVNVTDNAGNTTTRESGEIKVDTHPPDLKVDAKDLWK